MGWLLKTTLAFFAVAFLLIVLAFMVLLQRIELAEPYTPLMVAVMSGDTALVKKLVDDGADVNERRGHQVRYVLVIAHAASHQTHSESAIHFAVEHAHIEMIALLAELGADFSAKDSEGAGVWSYAREAVNRGNGVEVFELLSALTGDAIPEPSARVALSDAMGNGDSRLAEYLINRLSLSREQIEQLYCTAVQFGNIQAVEILRTEYGYVPDGILGCVWTLRISPKSYQMLRYLLEHDVDPNVPGKGGWLPLTKLLQFRAFSEHAAAQIELLLEYGADPEFVDRAGRNALEALELGCQLSVDTNSPSRERCSQALDLVTAAMQEKKQEVPVAL